MLVGQILRQRYKIIRLLGSGSFGVTYLAEDLDLPDHPVCVVKNLKQNHNPEYLQLAGGLFDREAKVLYHLGNECNQIPRLFAHFEENGEFYLVQEFIDGHDLSEEIFPGKKWSEAEVIQLLEEILKLLSFIHNKNIIHRDIKPQNLMRRKADGKIVLIDFGAVKQISGLVINAQGQTSVSVIVGTTGYMPSEQLNGVPKLSSDIYAVGMLGIYALTGIKPQELPRDSGSCEVFWRNLASVSPKLADVLDKMVSYHFNERYQTASEALQALTSLSPSTFSSPSPLQSLLSSILPEVGANQKFLISAGVGVGVLLGMGLLFVSFWSKPTPKTVQLTPEPTQSTPEPTQPTPEPTQSTFEDVPLVCPETPPTPLPSKPDWQNGSTKYYNFQKNQQNQPTGKGTLVYPGAKSGDIRYDGELKDGKFSGCGTYTFENGDRYIGEFDNNAFQGKGKLTFKNGCQYIGEFEKNKYEGSGTWIPKDGLPSSGTWKQGKLNNQTFSCD